MKNILPIAGILLLFLVSSCSIIYKNTVYDSFNENKPVNIGVIISHKSILERPAGHDHHFSEDSIFPDTLDDGSFLGYKNNSTDEDFIDSKQIYNIFKLILEKKTYHCNSIEANYFIKPDTIKNIITRIRGSDENQFDAVLFVDYSPMFNREAAKMGIWDNPGHSCYYRYGLFDLHSGQILIRYKKALFLEFYFNPKPSVSEIANDITNLMQEDLEENFPYANL